MNPEKNFARFLSLFFNNLHEYPADKFDPEILYRNGDVDGARIYFFEVLNIIRENAQADVLAQESLIELEKVKLWSMSNKHDIDSMISMIDPLISQCRPFTPHKFDLLKLYLDGLKNLDEKKSA
jgi:hypothetical protein